MSRLNTDLLVSFAFSACYVATYFVRTYSSSSLKLISIKVDARQRLTYDRTTINGTNVVDARFTCFYHSVEETLERVFSLFSPVVRRNAGLLKFQQLKTNLWPLFGL